MKELNELTKFIEGCELPDHYRLLLLCAIDYLSEGGRQIENFELIQEKWDVNNGREVAGPTLTVQWKLLS